MFGRRSAVVMVVASALATGSSGVMAAGAPRLPAAPQERDALRNVAATSARNAWAVGFHWNFGARIYQPLIERWNGHKWSVAQASLPGRSSSPGLLNDVSALSATYAWAVGRTTPGVDARTLIEHWNGKAWKVVPSPNIAGAPSALESVTATSASNAWAVGEYTVRSVSKALIEHWNGRAWRRVPDGTASGVSGLLHSVAATSSSDAWAVGTAITGNTGQTLTLHWNGRMWRRVASRNAGRPSNFFGVAAASPKNAWAVGSGLHGTAQLTLIEHWTGTAWKVLPTPNPSSGRNPSLFAVAAPSAKFALAVGAFFTASGGGRTLAERWSGTAWKVVPTPNVGGSAAINNFTGVSALSASDAWAVGAHTNGALALTLIEHWNGKAWKVLPSPSL
jgi:hypothetical protein